MFLLLSPQLKTPKPAAYAYNRNWTEYSTA